MKSIHKIYTVLILLLTISTVTFTSCKKLMDIPGHPSDEISTEQAFSDSSDVQSVMAGVYTSFLIVDWGSPGFQNGGLAAFTGLSDDELIYFSSNDVTSFYENALLPTNSVLENLWSQAYTTLYYINAALEGVAASNGLSVSLKQHVKGELETVRALCYFNLVNLFGPVPLVTSTDYKVTSKLPRASVDDVYKQIVNDLEDANTLLAPGYPSTGRARPNIYTAKALLAKVYLYLKDWQKAADLSEEVITSGLYSLEPDLNSVFLDGSNEAIWQLPAMGTFTQTNEAYFFVPYPGDQPTYELTLSLLNTFENGDQRKVNWISGEDVNGVHYDFPYKYKNLDSYEPTTEDYMVFRLAEQYLIHAEAMAQLDHPNEAVADINMIRERAGLPDISFTDKETLLNDIMHERRVELFCEWGNRWFDLKRTNTADAVLGSKPNWQSTDTLYPVPQQEIRSNPALTQNPGY